jgi:hypothetical protein
VIKAAGLETVSGCRDGNEEDQFGQVARHRLRCAHESAASDSKQFRRTCMLTKMLCPAVLILLALAPYGVAQAADMAIDCKLKGGTVVQLPAAACALEGGTPVSAAVAPAAAAPADASAAGNQPPGSKLEEAQKSIVGLLSKSVESTTPLNRNPEGIERTAKFDGCKLTVNEDLHIQYGNFYSVWKDFKISSVIDFQKIDRDEFGILGEVASKGGDFKATAVYVEERKHKDGNNISISVLNLRDGSYTQYRTHGPSAYLETPRDDLWVADVYGYPKDTGMGNVATDRVRILLMVSSSEDAVKLDNAFEEVNTMCRAQPAEAK